MRHRFTVLGDASPQLPLRVLGLFAQQDLLPSLVTMAQQGEAFEIVIECGGLTMDRAQLVLAKMETMVLVRTGHLETDCPVPGSTMPANGPGGTAIGQIAGSIRRG